MAGYEFQFRQVFGEELRRPFGTVLMIDSVKSVAANPLCYPLIRAWVDGGCRRQLTMESSIEDGDLRDGSEFFLDEVYSLQLYPVMERRKNGHALDGGFDVRGDDRWLRILTASVHDAVPDSSNLRFSGQYASFAGCKSVEQARGGFGALTNSPFFRLGCSRGIPHFEDCPVSLPFYFSFPQGRGRRLRQGSAKLIQA